MQYTIRQISKKLDQVLRKRAKAEGKSINKLVVEQLTRVNGLDESVVKKRDLSDLAGTWVDDPVFDEIRKMHEQIDPEMWK